MTWLPVVLALVLTALAVVGLCGGFDPGYGNDRDPD